MGQRYDICFFCWWFEMISYDLRWLQDIWSDLIIFLGVGHFWRTPCCLFVCLFQKRGSFFKWILIGLGEFFEILGELSGTVINPLGGRNGPWWQRPRLGRWRAGPRPHPVKMKARKGLGGERDMDVLWCCFVGWKTEWNRTCFQMKVEKYILKDMLGSSFVWWFWWPLGWIYFV